MSFLLTARSVLLWWIAIAVVTGVVWAIACTPGRAEERAIEERAERADRFRRLAQIEAARRAHPSSQPPDSAA